MLMTISTEQAPALDLSYLLAKHPARCQTFELAYGKVHAFYPDARDDKTTFALLMDFDPVGLVRGGRPNSYQDSTLEDYVNDRPYTVASFFAVAMAQVLRSAMKGTSKERPERAMAPIPLEVTLSAVRARGGEPTIRALFEPLGYELTIEQIPLDECFPEWGESRAYRVEMRAEVRLSDLLTQLYVLIPSLDTGKHYWVGQDEVQKLLEKGGAWLSSHPAREMIVRRYLGGRRRLSDDALGQLEQLDQQVEPDPQPELQVVSEDVDRNATVSYGASATELVHHDEPPAGESVESPSSGAEANLLDATDGPLPTEEAPKEPRSSLNALRYETVIGELVARGVRSVVDLGCGEGRMLQRLLREPSLHRIVGADVSLRALSIAEERLHRGPNAAKAVERVELMHSSILYTDPRLHGIEAACAVEVIEHLELSRLDAVEHTLFHVLKPRVVVITTPNVEYNVKFENLNASKWRHADHRFEWTRAEFETWARDVAHRRSYAVDITPVGPIDEQLGSPTQMAVFYR